jgi:hypothetical protein
MFFLRRLGPEAPDAPMRLVVVPILALLGTAVGGCSAAAGPKYPDLVSFCNARASAECSNAVVLACAVPSAASCVTNRAQVCVASQPSGTVYDPTSAQGCVNEVSNAYSDAQLTLSESTAIDMACLSVFDGPGSKDATCQTDGDCKLGDGLRCVLAAGAAMGTCQVPTSVTGGGSCAAADAQCVAGFHCGPTANCDIDAMQSAPCSSVDPCAVGLLCSSANVCVPKSADGSACASNDECLNGICNEGSTATMGLCVSEVTLSPDEPFCVDSR